MNNIDILFNSLITDIKRNNISKKALDIKLKNNIPNQNTGAAKMNSIKDVSPKMEMTGSDYTWSSIEDLARQ